MKKILAALLAFLLLLPACAVPALSESVSAPERKPDVYYANGALRTKYEYNGDGLLQKTTYYNRYGRMTQYMVAEAWDEAGRVLEETVFYMYDPEPSSYHYTYTYNRIGKTATSRSVNQKGEFNWSSAFEYDDSGKKIRTTAFGEDGSIKSYTEDYTYDENGKQTGSTDLDANRNVISRYRATWENGACVAEEYLDPQGNVTGRYTYDPVFGDELTREYTYGNDSYTSVFTYYDDSYAEDWQCVTTGSRNLMTYGTDGKMIREESYDRDQVNGGWILKRTSVHSTGADGTEIVKSTDADGEVWYREEDKQRHTSLVMSWKADGTYNHGSLDELDANGNTVRSTQLDEGRNRGAFSLYEYDERNQRTKVTAYEADGAFKYGFSYEYDGEGRQTRENRLAADGSVLSYELYKYDAAGNKTRMDSCEGDGTLKSYTIYEYNDKGRYTHYTSYRPDGSVSSETFFRYLEDGTSQRKFITYRSDGTVMTEYDWE